MYKHLGLRKPGALISRSQADISPISEPIQKGWLRYVYRVPLTLPIYSYLHKPEAEILKTALRGIPWSIFTALFPGLTLESRSRWMQCA